VNFQTVVDSVQTENAVDSHTACPAQNLRQLVPAVVGGVQLKLTISPVELMRHSAHAQDFCSWKSMPVRKRLLDSCWTPINVFEVSL
jgi:hypothetical protein